MLRLVQFLDEAGRRRVGVSSDDPGRLRVVAGYERVYDLAQAAIRAGGGLEALVRASLSDDTVEYDPIVTERRLLPPLDHADPARCTVTLTGLTHLGSAKARDQIHLGAQSQAPQTDSMRMFAIGLEGGRPAPGEIGAEPEWAYKGDGRCVVPPECPLPQPAFARDGGEEAELAGLYLIDEAGAPWRVGYALGNEFADHVLEKQNYLYLAHSKLRACSIGPELLVGALPEAVSGTVRVLRDGAPIWDSPFETGEANMSHSIGNLEHHHFKYDLFRRPGDIHVHFFGANGVSFGAGVQTQAGDVFEIEVPLFGRPLRNPLQIETGSQRIQVKPL